SADGCGLQEDSRRSSEFGSDEEYEPGCFAYRGADAGSARAAALFWGDHVSHWVSVWRVLAAELLCAFVSDKDTGTVRACVRRPNGGFVSDAERIYVRRV